MSQILEVKIPDIGDFHDIPVIEVMVKPGDVVKAEDSLITLESDKATMDVPSPSAGTAPRAAGPAISIAGWGPSIPRRRRVFRFRT